MATVTKTWTFPSNSNGWTEVGDDAGEAFGFTDVGAQAVQFTRPTAGTSSERARTGAGVTWETWGVPSGATVNSIIFSASTCRNATSGITTTNIKGRIVDSSNTTILVGGDSLDSSFSGTSYVTRSGTSKDINSSYQSSTTNIKAEMTGNITSTSTNRGWRSNSISVQITYSTTPSFTAKARRFFSNLVNRIGTRTVK